MQKNYYPGRNIKKIFFLVFTALATLSFTFTGCGGGFSDEGAGGPVISSFAAAESVLYFDTANNSTSLSVTASDPNGSVSAYAYDVISDESGGTLLGNNTAHGKTYSAGSGTGAVVIKVTVIDNGGNTVEEFLTITVLAKCQKITGASGPLSGAIIAGDAFGRSVVNIGDLNNDGNDDIAVGAHGVNDGDTDAGAIYILFLNKGGSIKSFQKISALEGGFPGWLNTNDYFGSSIASLGDINGDGINDLAVGAEGDDEGGSFAGSMWILMMNTNGTVKYTQKINYREGVPGGAGGLALGSIDRFGFSAAGIGDLDGDGVNDLAVGAIQDDEGGDAGGAVWVLFLNSNGTVKKSQKINETNGNFTDPLDNDHFGASVAGLGDLDGDGIIDLAVGAHADNDGPVSSITDTGSVWILFMNRDGTVKSHQKISMAAGNFAGPLGSSDYFGISASNIGDLDGDGIIDLAVGAHCDEGTGANTGAAWILFLNADGTVKGEQKISEDVGGFSGDLNTNDNFSHGMAGIRNSNGTLTLFVGAHGDDESAENAGALWMMTIEQDGTLID
ncbi:MAG: hypothetical protein GY754_37170 [bacterium]|nr:hypothetical protein [bacterium]